MKCGVLLMVSVGNGVLVGIEVISCYSVIVL